jgi:hypothetical protein
MVLQNDTDEGKGSPGLCSETDPLQSHTDHMISIKVEKVSDEEEAVPVGAPWQAMKAEVEVSCMSNRYADLLAVFLIKICLFVFLPISLCA